MISARFEYKIQDMWVGLFWRGKFLDLFLRRNPLDIWICFVPCYRLHVEVSA